MGKGDEDLIRIAVCDDNQKMCDIISDCVRNAFAAHQVECAVCRYTNGTALLQAMENEKIEVLFLDIMMPEQDGFHIAEKIRKKYPEIHIVFITANSELVFRSFTYQPFYFICKGSKDEISADIVKTVNLLLERVKQYSLILLDTASTTPRVQSIKEIIYIENSGHYLVYHMVSGEQIKVRNSMQNIADDMESYDFARIHRKFMVNLLHVKKIIDSYDFMLLSDGSKLEISRNCRQDTCDKYLKYMRISDLK